MAEAPPARNTADKVFDSLQDQPGMETFLKKLRRYSRLHVDLNRLLDDAKRESFERVKMFVANVSKISLAPDTPWTLFAAAVIIYEA